jgi:hypothetical protein
MLTGHRLLPTRIAKVAGTGGARRCGPWRPRPTRAACRGRSRRRRCRDLRRGDGWSVRGGVAASEPVHVLTQGTWGHTVIGCQGGHN